MESDATAGSSAGESGNSKIQVIVKFAGESIAANISPNSKVEELKSVLLPLTNVLPRCQKLICKGRVLADESTLSSYGIINKSKIMLMATAGLHQGDAPMKKEAGSVGIGIGIQRVVPEQKKVKENLYFDESQVERWQISRVIPLPERNLREIPDEVWLCGDSVGLLDVSWNLIQTIPDRIRHLSSLMTLMLDSNKLQSELISWEGLVSLKSLLNLYLQHNCLRALPSCFGALTSLKKLDISRNYIRCFPSEIGSLTNLEILYADYNRLTALPSSFGALTSLKKLSIEHNELTRLPTEIGSLTNLEILDASNNRIDVLPETFGGCVSLFEINFSSNDLVELPETFENLKSLEAMNLSNNNRLRSIPSSLFKTCVQLSSLKLGRTNVTTDMLRQFEGWEEFDERRRLNLNKQLEFEFEFETTSSSEDDD